MGLFSRAAARNDDETAFAETPGAPPPEIFMPDVNDPDSVREFVSKRLCVEAQLADTSASRISALKALADVAAVTSETKFRVDRRLTDNTTNIVVIQEALRGAKQKALEHHGRAS